jgi:hypothetical protein
MFCVSVKLWRHSDILVWVPFSWALRMSEGGNLNCIKEAGLSWLGLQSMGHKGPVKGLCVSGLKGHEAIFFSILCYSILFYFILSNITNLHNTIIY